MISYPVLAAIFGCCFLAIGCVIFTLKDGSRIMALPRMRIPGAVLGGWIIFVCVPHIMELMGPESVLTTTPVLWIVAVLFWIACVKYADFLFARAFAAACIYAAYLLLREGFAYQPPLYPAVAAIAFLTGILGILIGAKPVWMREWLEAAVAKKTIRKIMGGIFCAAGMFLLIDFALCMMR